MGLLEDPPPPCDDPSEAFFPPDSITRTIHMDLPAMLIGGLASLLLQMLHPRAMAGVAQHSNYREDPLGRLERTAMFVGMTTFRSTNDAHEAIERVKSIHRQVVGTTSDGEPYSADDPDLLTWVHAAEVSSFLAAAIAFGGRPLSLAERDAYVDEMARVALALGAIDVPRTVADLEAYFEGMRPHLRLTPEARDARNFVLLGVHHWPHEVATYGVLLAAAQSVLPSWARRQLRLPGFPGVDRLAIRPAALTLSHAMRWVAIPPSQT